MPGQRGRLNPPKPRLWVQMGSWWSATLVIVGLMLVLGEVLRRGEVIFPEGAALAFGVIGLRTPGWRRSPLAIALLPLAGASFGVMMVHLGGPRWAAEVAAMSAALVLLIAARSELTPVISAALFPVIFGVSSWLFPVSVAVLGGTVALIARATQGRRMASAEIRRKGLPTRAVLGAWTLFAVLLSAGGLIGGLPTALMAPPLFVAAIGQLVPEGYSRARVARQWAVLVAAAAVGVAASRLVHPPWVGGLLAVAITIAVFAVTATPHSPALAVCLIPQAVVVARPAQFVGAIAAGAAILSLAVYGMRPLVAGPFRGGDLSWAATVLRRRTE